MEADKKKKKKWKWKNWREKRGRREMVTERERERERKRGSQQKNHFLCCRWKSGKKSRKSGPMQGQFFHWGFRSCSY